jgi:hypothetical protein
MGQYEKYAGDLKDPIRERKTPSLPPPNVLYCMSKEIYNLKKPSRFPILSGSAMEG